tara:strand:+ start:973 stop:1683 length:711 start_codon:yes stop_codon:yes gene_type:complete
MSFYLLLGVIILFGSMQSIFGIGLLIFGTPLLLIFGYDFVEVLWILLPTSCSLSLFQITENYKLIEAKKEVFFLTLPMLILSLLIILNFEFFNIKKIVGVFLILTTFIRFFNLSKKWSEIIMLKGKNLMYLLIGFIHGLSNLGGGPLAVLETSIHKDSKAISSNIAFVYLILATSQIIILLIYKSEMFIPYYLIFIPIVILNHMILRKIIYKHIISSNFNIFINIFIFVFGFICLL